MARKTKQQSLETRQHIIDAAIKLFSTRGVSNTSLNDIAMAAGVTRGAIYWHFKNKLDLFLEMWQQLESSIEAIERRYQDQYPDDPLHVFRQTLTYVLHSLATEPRRQALTSIVFHKCEFVGDMVPMQEIHRRLYLENYEKIEKTIAACIKLEQLPQKLDVHKAAIIVRSYVCGLMDNWLLLPDSFNLEASAPQLVDSLIDMLKFSPSLIQD